MTESPSFSDMKGYHNFITSVAIATVINYFLCKKIKPPFYSTKCARMYIKNNFCHC